MILLTGPGGQLGTAFRSLLGDDVHPVGRADLDLRDPEAADTLVRRFEPSLVINCGAYTAVDAAESDEETATIVNGRTVAAIARACAAIGSRLLTFSTDYVFDGTKNTPYVESDPVRPINAYGRSKAVGEQAALDALPDALVIRTSWVISRTHPNFVRTMLSLGMQGRALQVVDDQVGRATIADDLASHSWQAVHAGASGILHLSNPGPLTWYELANRSFELAGLETGLLTPCTTADFPRPARRPTNSVLNSERLGALDLDDLPSLDAGLPRLVAETMAGLAQDSSREAR